MPDRPILFLANFASLRRPDPAVVGTGRRWTAMARPRAWERGEGDVWYLSPDVGALDAVKSGAIAPAEYFERFRAKLDFVAVALPPGQLHASRPLGCSVPGKTTVGVTLRSGDFIGCSCSRVAALAGQCHLTHAAPALVRAGWDVYVHGHRAYLAEDGTLALLGPWQPDRTGEGFDEVREWLYPLGVPGDYDPDHDTAAAIGSGPDGGAVTWAVWAPLTGDVVSVTGVDVGCEREARAKADAELDRMERVPVTGKATP